MSNAEKLEVRPPGRRRHVALALLIIAVSLLATLVPARAYAPDSDGDSSANTPEYTTWNDLSGKTVGMVTGATFETALREKCPDVGDVVYYSTTSDLIAALQAHKVDAFINSMAVGTLVQNRYSDLALFPEVLGEYEIGIAFPKGSNLTSQFGQIIDRLRDDGTSNKLWDKWTAGDDGDKTVPEQDWAGANGTYRVAACQSLEPVSYLGNGQMLGFDIEMLLTCAKELDVHLDFKPMEFSDVLSYIQSGKSDFGCGSILITKERAEAMDFAPTHENDLILVVRAADGGSGSGGSFIDGIAQSFYKTFIKENRWTYIVSGLGTTMIITLSSAILGTALGFITVLLRRRGNRVAGALVGGFEGLMNRLPIVVVLMVFYYVIFGSANLSGTVVSIFAFTLAFGATAGSIMWSSVRAVDGGQSEASLALGFSENQTFFGVVLPQAAHQFLPMLSSQIVSLTKQTAVVGYIAVMDLTRASDVIRSLTMEAFFPLFCIAAIYFALCCVFATVLGAVIRRLDYERKPRTVKGVDL
ncbi:MAG: ABC transporter substrate-binding protein/permease [Coriobacteriales bacterium]|nr:ABC transporter substrate-binding protein/permease [Coriobacteriales bacterium]